MTEADEQEVPMVSVALICFRQGRFIARALEGVLAQQTDFLVELVVGDDRSEDATLAIVHERTRGHRFQVRVLPSETRLGMHQNVHRTVAACRGRYVALLEGDDYWLDENKLALQVSLMESRPEAALCFHPVEMREEPGETLIGELPGADRRSVTLAPEALLEENFIPTSSVLLRRSFWPDYDARFACLGLLDWVLWWKLSLQGAVGCVDRLMGVYRVHQGGIWSGAADDRRLRELRRMALIIARTCPPVWRQPWLLFAARRSRDLFYDSILRVRLGTALLHLVRHVFDRLHARALPFTS
jgi:glycosyltransferase involved in cell wall biosynthesis